MEEDYSIPLLFLFLILWFAWYKLTDSFWLSGIINAITYSLGWLSIKIWS